MIKCTTLTFTIITTPGQPVPANQFDDAIMKFREEKGITAENMRGTDYFCSSVFIPRADVPISTNPKGVPIFKQMGNIIQNTFCCNLEWETEDDAPANEDIKLKIVKDEAK